MKMKCCVTGCENPSRFTFPKNEVVRRQWLEAIRRPDFVPKHKHGLCADHFKPEDIPTESYNGGYKIERVVLRRHTVPSVFPWTKGVLRREKKIIRNVGNSVEIRAENAEELDFESSYKKCLENLIDNPFQSIFIKSERYELDGIDKDDVKIYKKIRNNDNANNCQVNKVIFRTEEQQPGKSNFEHNHNPQIVDQSYFYIENDIRLLDHDYHVAKIRLPGSENKLPPRTAKPRYDIEDFRNDSQGLKVFTGLTSYDRFMDVFRRLGEKVYKLVYTGNGATGKLSVKNQFFLTLWKLKRNCSDFDLSRHFSISTVAAGNIFRTWVRFLAMERPKIEIRPGREMFEYYKVNRFEKYYAPASAESTDDKK